MNTIRSALARAQVLLGNAPELAAIDARYESQLLLQHTLNANRAWLIAHENDSLPSAIEARFDALLQRRLKGEPMAYILGSREFYGLDLDVTPATLIPRPDTEILVDAALDRIPAGLALQVLDLGTGTGAIALAIAHQRPHAHVTAVDASQAALDIAISNNEVFAVKTDGGAKVVLFDRLSNYIADDSKRDNFCRAIINKLVEFSFERIFTQKFDFYATIFEYLIKDYNSNSGGKYAEYFTPHAVARIMAEILVPKAQQGQIKNVSVYDPSAGSGTLLMNVAHAIGENRCSIYTQDISQKSANLLRLNLILNNLVHSIPQVIQGNTLLHPYHKEGSELKRFDYIVSNPPFKLDFSDYRDELDSKANQQRFFAGIPKVKAKATDKMEIYQLFL